MSWQQLENCRALLLFPIIHRNCAFEDPVVVYVAQIRFSVGKRLSTFSYSLSHQTPNFGIFPTSTAKIPSSSTPPQDANGLIVVSNVCVLCLTVTSLTLSMHMLIRLAIFNDFARLYISPPVMYKRCLPSNVQDETM